MHRAPKYVAHLAEALALLEAHHRHHALRLGAAAATATSRLLLGRVPAAATSAAQAAALRLG